MSAWGINSPQAKWAKEQAKGFGPMEYTVEGTVCNKATLNGWLVRKVVFVGRVACMDRLFIKGGRVVFIEFKAPKKEPRLTQDREIGRFRDAGAEVHVVDRVADGLRILGLE